MLYTMVFVDYSKISSIINDLDCKYYENAVKNLLLKSKYYCRLNEITGQILFESQGRNIYFKDLSQGICGTGDSFETGLPKVSCNLVDMEGYALAKVCKKLDVRLISIKYISDGANDSAHLDWEENLLLGAQKLLKLYQSI